MRRRATLPSDARSENGLAPRILIYDFHEDDPGKCTSARLQKFHFAKSLHSLKQIPSRAIILNPISNLTLSFEDREQIDRYGLVALDCSWNRCDTSLFEHIRGENRRLPALLAGNPTNYSTRGKLSTAEAIASALFITGFERVARQILKIFDWGLTFLSLNEDPLKDYARTPRGRISEREREYFSTDEA